MDVINMISNLCPDGSVPDARVVRPGFRSSVRDVTMVRAMLEFLGEMKREVLFTTTASTVGRRLRWRHPAGRGDHQRATGALNMLFQFEHVDLDSVGGHMNASGPTSRWTWRT